jgi:hypothetical protein
MYFEFNVSGWTNAQFLKASSEAKAFEAAVKIGSGETNIFGFKRIAKNQVAGFLQNAEGV